MPSIDDFDPLFDLAGNRFKVDPNLIKGHIFVESGGNPNARNPSGAAGMAQIIPSTRDMIAKGLGQPDFDPNDPRDAINGAGWLISQNLDRYGNPAAATQAYNGFGHGGDPNYVQKVMAARNRFADSASAVGKAVIPGTTAPTAPTPQIVPTPPSATSAGTSTTAVKSLFDDATPTVPATQAAPTAPTSPAPNRQLFDDAPAPAPVAAPAVTPSTAPMPVPPAGAGVAGSPPVATPATPQWGEVNPLLHSGANAIVGGIGTGFGDVYGGINRMTGGMLPTLPNLAPPPDVQQAQAEHPVLSGAGRVAGQALATAPIMTALGPVLAPFGAAAESVPVIGGKILSGAVQGAGAGAAQGALTSGQDPNESFWSQVKRGAEFGGSLGAAFGGVGKLFGSGVDVAPQIAKIGNDAQKAGITVNPGNMPLDGTPGAAANLAQKGQINQAFGRVLGEDTPNFAAGTLKPTLDKVGGQISNAVKAGQVNYQAIQNDLANVEAQATAPGVNADTTAKIRGKLNDILQAASANNGVLTGQQFDTFVGKGSDLSNWAGSKDDELAGLAQKLDTALDKGFATSSPPGVYDRYVDAKTRFKLLKAVQDNVEGDPLGNIKPGTIDTDLKRRFPDIGTLDSSTGGVPGQVADLTRTVKQLFGGGRPLPIQPSTPLSGWVKGGLGVSGLGGAAEGYNALGGYSGIASGIAQHPIMTAAGVAGTGGAAALRAMGRAYQSSPTFARMMIERSAGRPNPLLPSVTAAGTSAAEQAVNPLLTPSAP